MSVRIRLRRIGKKKRPTYRFVAADSRSPRDGRFIEMLGWYNPIDKPARVQIKEEETYEWLKRGALPSETVLALYRQVGLWKKWELIKKGEDASELTVADRITDRRNAAKARKPWLGLKPPRPKPRNRRKKKPLPRNRLKRRLKKKPRRKQRNSPLVFAVAGLAA